MAGISAQGWLDFFSEGVLTGELLHHTLSGFEVNLRVCCKGS